MVARSSNINPQTHETPERTAVESTHSGVTRTE